MIKALLFLTAVGLSHGAVRSLMEPNSDCPENGHWLLPHEYDCTKFYYCDRGQKFINPTDCPANTEFSVTLQVCTHIGTSGCTLPGPSTVSPDSPTDPSPAPTQAPTDAPDNVTTPGPVDLLENGCPADSNIHMLLPHETSCTKFYYCVHGEKALRSCGLGTVFNPDIQVCDHPWNVNRDCEDGESIEDNSESEEDNNDDNSEEDDNNNDDISEEDDNNNDDNSEEDDNNNDDNNEEDDNNNDDNSEEDGNNNDSKEDDSEADDSEEDDSEELQPNGCPIEWSMTKYLPHEYYCNKSYQCVYGSVEEKACPPGTHFSYELLVSLTMKKKVKTGLQDPLATLKICVTC